MSFFYCPNKKQWKETAIKLEGQASSSKYSYAYLIIRKCINRTDVDYSKLLFFYLKVCAPNEDVELKIN